MNERLVLLLRRVIYNLRGGFLIRPLTIALVLGCVGGLLSSLEEEFPAVGRWVPAVLFPSHADPQVAQVILAGIAASIMTVVSIVFAILLMTLTLASMQFSPRIILSFTRDRVTQWTLGIFLGTFCYCMAALPAARSLPAPFSPIATVLGAMLLAIACVCWLLFFIHHIAQAISVNQIVDKIASETEIIIDDMMPWPRSPHPVHKHDPLKQHVFETTILNGVSGYIRFIDTRRLVALAKLYRVKVHVLRRVGHFVPAGVPLLIISKGERLPADGRAQLLGAFDFGPSRTLQQDAEFGVLQIVDIALRALSPAVNDPSTAISCVDQLSRILIRFASRAPPEPLLYDPPAVFRVSIGWIDFPRLLEAAFEQVRMYSKGDLAVSLRMLRALGDIARTTEDSSFRAMLIERGRHIVAGCTEKLGEEDLAEMRRRLNTLESLLEPASAGEEEALPQPATETVSPQI
ncbi:MAG TPA: DUF2254 domain-containing protein [Steroidobacteraceae bacterium]|nr:DUF2254 domain-containing protein [Steroidobacteraceae bacterium]